MKYYLLTASLFFGFFIFNINIIEADTNNKAIRTIINKSTLKRGLTVKSLNNKFKLGIRPNSLSSEKKVNLVLKKAKKKDFNLENQKLLSKLYVYDLHSNQGVEVKNAIWLSIKYKNKKKIKGKKVIKFYNTITEKWQEIPSKKKKDKDVVQAAINLPYAVVGVFNKKIKKKKKNNQDLNEDYQIGVASWYDYHGAASTKYPYGSVVKVTNLANNKTVEVTIVDLGPFTPGRVIDLPREAFSALADIGEGLIKVKVEPIHIP